MIIEMKAIEALKEWENGTLTMILVDGELMDVEQFLEGVRWLVDLENAEVQVEDKSAEDKSEDAEMPARKPHAPKSRRPRRTQAEIAKEKDIVLKAWNAGEHSIEEVVEITGLSRAIVRKYLPASKNG